MLNQELLICIDTLLLLQLLKDISPFFLIVLWGIYLFYMKHMDSFKFLSAKDFIKTLVYRREHCLLLYQAYLTMHQTIN